MTWTPVTKAGDYTSGKRVGTQPGQQNLEADLTTLVNGVNAAGQYVDTHNADATAHTGTFYTKGQVDGFVGAGRTTETVMGSYAALETHKDSGDHDLRYYTQVQLDEGALDPRYPTRTDMSAAISNASLGVQTDGVVTDRAGAAAHITHRQGGADKFDWELDASGNLLQKRWDGSAWQIVATWTQASGAVAFAGALTASGGLSVTGTSALQAVTATTVSATTSITVNSAVYWGKLASAPATTNAGDFYYDTTQSDYQFYTGSGWRSFGLTEAQVQTIARTEALRMGGA